MSKAPNDEICRSRYCPVGTIMEGDGGSSIVNPTRGLETVLISPSKAPSAMDKMRLREEWMIRKYDKKDYIAKASSPGIAQIQLQLLLPQLQKAGLKYESISRFFEKAISELDMAREYKSVLTDLLIKDRETLRDSDACYAQVSDALQRRSGYSLDAIAEAIKDLASVLKSN